MACAELSLRALAWFLHDGGQRMHGCFHILGMDQFKGTAPDQFFWRIAQQTCGGRADIEQPPIRIKEDNGIRTLLDQGAETLFTRAELFLHLFAFREDRKSTRLNSSHQIISYAVFCLKKKNKY